MGMVGRVQSWWRSMRAGAVLDCEMREEFAHHMELRAADLMREGLAPADAVRRARLEFGSVESFREQGRESRGLRLFDELRGDVRYGLRALLRNRGFAFIAVLTLGLGIGATTAIFSALDAVLLRPLPFAEPERLVQVHGVDLPMSFGAFTESQTRPQLQDARQLEAFSHVAAYGAGALNLSGSGAPRRMRVGVVTADFFTTLGVQPAVGRDFSAEEGVPDGPLVAIVSHGFWRRHLAGATDLAAHTVTLNGRRYDVVGVMPADFAFPEASEIWIPQTVPGTARSYEPFRQSLRISMIARLSPGVRIESAQAQVDALHAPYARPDRPRNVALADQVRPLHGAMADQRRTVLLVLMGATVLVLLVACVNVANLLLARGSARRREIAVRAALGATPARVLRQMLVESLLLAALGGVAGVGMAVIGVHLLAALVPPALLGAAPLRIDARVLGFAMTLTLLTGLAFGLLPALGARRTRAGEALKASTAGAGGGRTPRTRHALVLAEVGLAVMLLVGSALMLRSMHALLTTESGVDPERVATLELSLAPEDYPTPEARRAFFEDVLARLQSRPGVESAAAINELPLRGEWGIRRLVYREGRPPEQQDIKYTAQDLNITADYFRTMGIRVLLGRAPQPRSDTLALQEVAINRELAELHWPGENPVGQRLESSGGRVKLDIVGVVENVLPASLASDPIPQAYWSLLENPYANAALVVRGRVSARALARLLEETVREAAPDQAVYNVRTMEQVIAGAVAAQRTNSWLIGVFGLLALVLAAVGVYGVIAFSVARRTREIGIRMALGARAEQLRWAVLREAGAVAVGGIVIGVIGAGLLSRVLSGMVYGVSVHDPFAFTVAPLVLLAAALLAALVPAQRATRVDPMAAIRVD